MIIVIIIEQSIDVRPNLTKQINYNFHFGQVPYICVMLICINVNHFRVRYAMRHIGPQTCPPLGHGSIFNLLLIQYFVVNIY